MYEYRGRCNPNRLLQREFLKSEVRDRLHLLIRLPLRGVHMGIAIEPYSQANPRPPVSRKCSLFHYHFGDDLSVLCLDLLTLFFLLWSVFQAPTEQRSSPAAS